MPCFTPVATGLYMPLALARLLCLASSIAGAIVLLRSGYGYSRPRRALGISLLIWSLLIVAVGVCYPSGYDSPTYLSPVLLVISLFLNITLLSYPLGFLKSSVSEKRRAMLLFGPAACLSVLFLGFTQLPGANGREILSYADFIGNIGRVDVLLRPVVLLTPYVYIAAVLSLVRRCRGYDIASDADAALIRGNLYRYLAALSLLCLSSLCVAFGASRLSIVAYYFIAAGFFSLVALKAYRHRNYYSRNHDHDDFTLSESDLSDSFSSKIPEYALVIREWFENEKPYLSHNFKLTDVAAVVPLNRTYLSRVFNEGLGCSFGDMVREHRIEEACRLLVEKPAMSIADIAEQCGFASHSTFHRSFVGMRGGLTPGDFRAEALKHVDLHSVKST